MRRQQRGAALLIVLWTALLLAILLAGLAARLRTESLIARTQIDRLAAMEAMEGAALVAAYRMARSRRNEVILPFPYRLNAYDVRVALSPEMRKLDVNLANERQLADFFTSIGIDNQEAVELAAKVADWRDADDLARPNGAEKGEYAGKAPPRNRSFLSVDELSLVLDMPSEVLTNHRDSLTLLGGYGTTNDDVRLLPGARVTLESSIVRGPLGPVSFPVQTNAFRATGKVGQPIERVRAVQ